MGHGLATGHDEVSPSSSEEVTDIPLAPAILCSILPGIDEQSYSSQLPASHESARLAYGKENRVEGRQLCVERVGMAKRRE